jgi:long-chain acyl-CoA synthetase
VVKGDRVGVTGKNSPEWAIAYLGILYSGAIVVPLDYSLHDDEMEKLIDFAGLKGLCVDRERINDVGKHTSFKVSLEEMIPDHPFLLDCQETEELPRTKRWRRIPPPSVHQRYDGNAQRRHAQPQEPGQRLFHCAVPDGHFPTDVFYAILPNHHAYTMLAVFVESFSVGAAVSSASGWSSPGIEGTEGRARDEVSSACRCCSTR